MRVLAFDPGYDRLGAAVVEKQKNTEELVFSECFTTSSQDPFEKRLYEVGTECERLITKYKPDAVALESLFFNTNQTTAMKVSAVRGVLMYCATKNELPLFEYTPLQIKIAATGYGRSSKKQVIDMVRQLITMDERKRHDDEYDAIAVALTCTASERI